VNKNKKNIMTHLWCVWGRVWICMFEPTD